MTKYIESYTSERVELEIYECDCGFHIGLDGTFIDQVGDIEIDCPSCKRIIDTSGEEE